MAKERYRELSALVREVVIEWNPYDLLGRGAATDEFDSEIAHIVAQVRKIQSEADATSVVSGVFSAAFEPQSFTVEACAAVGERLFARLRAAGFV